MSPGGCSRVAASAAAVALVLLAGALGGGDGWPGPPRAHAQAHGHQHVPVPGEYAKTRVPAAIWTDARVLARGKEIYASRCAACHGERGDGKGPGSAALALKPADLTDAQMVADMTPRHWFWRVSEGGQVEPFRSLGSAMPAWKHDLSVDDRWAVIAYARTLSGHRGAQRAPHPHR